MSDNIEVKQVLCPYCKELIRADALKCKHCQTEFTKEIKTPSNSLWVSILSLVLGVILLLSTFDENEWDKDDFAGFFTFAIASVTCGVITLHQKLAGKTMAILGLIFTALAVLIVIGSA
ncbi:hypothetical protein [Campylobacter mucosalis]|uniref:hypothetical protein n=1 Tax=Campylobacter mucosalis TaxID=202 RepID=UPI00146FDAFD|nr:hypothetical protein [Campylobacter mucosalis]